MSGLFDDSPGDVSRKVLRALGILDEAACDACGEVRPVSKLNLFEIPDPDEEHVPRFLLCDKCVESEIVAPFRERAVTELGEKLESSLAEAALAESLTVEEREEAVETLKRLIQERQQRSDDGDE